MALDTEADFLAEARALLQDTQTIRRYSDAELIREFHMGLQEMRRLRYDLFIDVLPGSLDALGTVDYSYRALLVDYMAGRALLREDEEQQAQKGAALLSTFQARLTQPLGMVAR